MDGFYLDCYNKKFWHSSAHILASALKEIYGNSIKLGIGPAIDNGFYYDVDFGDIDFTISDFKRLEDQFVEIANRDDEFIRRVVSKKEALEFFKNENNEYKLEIINMLNDGEITFYSVGKFVDLCKGPHIERSGVIRCVKILNIASAYWMGDEKNKQLTRIYAISFPNKEMLDEYLKNLEEAKLRDHKRIGQELKLFTFSEKVGLGLPLWLPRGTVYRNLLTEFLTNEQIKRGYKHVVTPHIGHKDLYITSGHYAKYGKDSFQPIKTPNEDEEYLLKPMNCPHHCEIYKSEMRSYKNLPLKIAEFGTVYRYEQHGELHGLARTRCFTQDDSHIFCRRNQVEQQIEEVIDLIQFVFKKLGFTEFKTRLSFYDKNDFSKYIGDRSDWDKAEMALEETVKRKGLEYVKVDGEAAFYGPKIDFIIKDAIKREWQLGTVQLDYNLPNRFNLSFINENNEKETPVMIHRAPLGSIERLTAILIEHTSGKLPLWLAPDQLIILPISEKTIDYSNNIFRILEENKIRVTLDDRRESLNKKIREAEMMKIPLIAIIGEQEIAENMISIRESSSKRITKYDINRLIDEIKTKCLN